MLLLSTVCAFSQEQAPTPAFRDRDFWHFKIKEDVANVSSTRELDGVYELIYANGAVKVFHLPSGQRSELALDQVDRAGVFRGLLGLNPKRPDLKFPLYIGQAWTYSFQGSPIGSRVTRTRHVEVRVIGIDQVTTQAGNFVHSKLSRDQIGVPAAGDRRSLSK
jgi:hypothetical protein